jgi:ribosome-associated protein
MDRVRVRRWLEDKAEITFSRSSGPGGQNVNKVNTKSTIRAALDSIDGLSPEERDRLSVRLGRRITVDRVLVVQAQDERSQSMNREIAIERAMALIEGGLRRPATRRATRPTKASRERRLSSKRVEAWKKRGRHYEPEE